MVDVLRHFRDNPDAAERVDFNYISPVNEPQWDWNTNSQEGNRASVADIKSWTNALATELQNQGVSSQITLVESGQIQDMYGGKNYVSNLAGDANVNTKLGNRLSYHSYFSDDPAAQLTQTRTSFAAKMAQYPGWKAWQTEYCILGSNGPGRDLTMTTALNVARVIHFDLSIANVSAWQWWLAMSPHDYKDGLLYVDMDEQAVVTSKTFWALGNYSRFIRPGAKRIDSAADNSNVNGLLVSAYRDDTSRELIAVYVNQQASAKTVKPVFSGAATYKADYVIPFVTSDTPGDDLKKYGAFELGDSYDLPAKSVVTVVSGTLNEDNTGKTIRRLNSDNNHALGSGVLALSPGDGSFGGVLSGAGGFEKKGGGVQTLAANNAFSGPTIVSGGTLALAGANLSAGRIAASSAVQINAGGAIRIDGYNALGGYTTANIPAVTINAGGKLTTADTITCNLASITLAGGELASGSPNPQWGSWTINNGITASGNTVSTIGASRAQLRGVQTFSVNTGSELRVTGTLENLGGGSGSLIKAGGGTLVLLGSNSYTGGTFVNAGTLVIAHPSAVGTGSLTVAGGVAKIASSVAPKVPSLTVSSGAADVSDRGIVIDYSGSTPLSTIGSLIASGYASGSWTGPGTNSSAAAASDPAHPLAVGFAEAATVGLAGGNFLGQGVDSTAVLIRCTYAGDFNLDAFVDTLDFNALAGNFGASGKLWSDGDANFDGSDDSLDFNVLASNFGLTFAPAATVAGAADAAPGSVSLATNAVVPEPLELIWLPLLTFASRRVRRSH